MVAAKNSQEGDAVRAFTIAVITFFSLSLMADFALAKEPYAPIEPLLGQKLLTTYKLSKDSNSWSRKSAKKFSKKRATLVEFLYMGGTELQLNDGKQIRRVRRSGWMSNHFTWMDDSGRTFEVLTLPYESGTLYGSIYLGNNKVGTFSLKNTTTKQPPAAGRWIGELAFPGGASLPIALQVSGLSDDYTYGGCQTWLPSRLDMPGAAYSEAFLKICGKGEQNHTMNFFYWDEDNGQVWLFHIKGSLYFKNTVFQGWASAFSVYGSGFSEGKFYLERPQPFSL
jgi:hypothetical protein